MLRTIHLHGRLGDKFGKEFRFDVATAAEAVRALATNFNEFLLELQEGSYEVVRGNYFGDDPIWLDESEVAEFKLGHADLHIVPHIEGSKNARAGGSLKIILGVALIGVAVAGAFFTGGMSLGMMGTTIPGLGISFGNVAMVGVALILAGVARLLTPTQQNPNEQASFLLNGPGNSYAQGNPVPLVYGEVIVGSQLISGSIDIEPIPVNWDPTNGNTVIMTYDPETGQGIISGNPAQYTQPSGST